jgi:hypothetical protein
MLRSETKIDEMSVNWSASPKFEPRGSTFASAFEVNCYHETAGQPQDPN